MQQFLPTENMTTVKASRTSLLVLWFSVWHLTLDYLLISFSSCLDSFTISEKEINCTTQYLDGCLKEIRIPPSIQQRGLFLSPIRACKESIDLVRAERTLPGGVWRSKWRSKDQGKWALPASNEACNRGGLPGVRGYLNESIHQEKRFYWSHSCNKCFLGTYPQWTEHTHHKRTWSFLQTMSRRYNQHTI